MSRINLLLIILLFGAANVAAQEQRNVLIEGFTNSHCGNCPPAHNALNNYLNSSPNGDRVNFIYYHMKYPYSSDPLYQHNSAHSDARDQYYGPFFATPLAFFEGSLQNNMYSQWPGRIDALLAEQSPLKITLTGNKFSNGMNINAGIYRSGNINETDLSVHFVVVETVNYQGNNGIAVHKNVMRKMAPEPGGQSIEISQGQTLNINQQIIYHPVWIHANLKVVVFVQSISSKKVYQSQTIPYSDLQLTSVGKNDNMPNEYSLQQNYPNPFNPATVIGYSIPADGTVQLKVFNILGKEVATLVNSFQHRGSYEVLFDAESFSSGVYFYRISYDGKALTRKMILNK